MRLYIVKVVLVGLAVSCCESATRKRSVEVDPAAIQEIHVDTSLLSPDEIPLMVERASNPDAPPVHPDEFVDHPDRPAEGPAEAMETADAMVFRPLFAHRSQGVARRSVGYRQQRRGDATSSGARGNYFSNPPPYLVYDRKSGAYYPYYYQTNYNNVRRG